MQPRNVGIFLFEGVEVLDFAGPFEVFSRTRLEPGAESRRSDDGAPFRVFTIAVSGDPVRATGGLTVVPAHDIAAAPDMDILVVPGGFGTRRLLDDATTLQWLEDVSRDLPLLTSVCTGSLVLAKAGLLRERRATTHWAAIDLLSRIDPTIRVERDARVVDDVVVTSAGVAAGIDMAFALVERFCGQDVADETARYIEYPRQRHG